MPPVRAENPTFGRCRRRSAAGGVFGPPIPPPAVTARRSMAFAAAEADVHAAGILVVNVERHTIALVSDRGAVRAVDNRCPHMGFPLHRGSLRDGTHKCHWHHARSDLASGGTFDQWADDLRSYPVEVRDGGVW